MCPYDTKFTLEFHIKKKGGEEKLGDRVRSRLKNTSGRAKNHAM
jgi:hypothetical protein